MNGSIGSTVLEKGLILTVVGLAGVFLILVIFFGMIKLLARIFPDKPEDQEES